MRPCFGKRKLLAWMALGELDERRAQDLRSHIQACEGCRRYLEDLSGLQEQLSETDTSPDIEPSAFFHREWVARLKAQPSSSSWRLFTHRLNWRVTLPALGAAAMVLILTLSMLPHQPGVSAPPAAGNATAKQPFGGRDLSPSFANYQHAASRSLDEFDDLLTAQTKRTLSPAPVYTASIFAAATSQN